VTVLGCRKARPTGRALARALQTDYSEQGIRSEGIVLRYGNASLPDPEDQNIINKLEAVRTSSNKPRCKKLLMDHNIPTPKLIPWEQALQGDITFPVIVRKNTHFQGKFFWVVNNVQELRRFDPTSHYIQEKVEKIDEFRLFLLKDRIIEADLKECPTPGILIRNHQAGCFFRWVRVASLPNELKRAARDAIDKCGLDFGAIDCATTQKPDGRTGVTIFELNSAPGLVPRKVDLLVNKIHELCI
jgi:glutathione synthase/RimK-type ligase-like ATP-grasp enzyme